MRDLTVGGFTPWKIWGVGEQKGPFDDKAIAGTPLQTDADLKAKRKMAENVLGQGLGALFVLGFFEKETILHYKALMETGGRDESGEKVVLKRGAPSVSSVGF